MRLRRLVVCSMVAVALPVSAAAAKGEAAYVVSGEAIVDHGGGVMSERTVSVIGDPSTTDVVGTYRFRVYGPDFDIQLAGSVDCLTVVGNTAYISGVLTESNRPDIPVGTPFYSALSDGGPAGVDVVAPIYLNPGVTCSPPSFQPEFVVTSGDLTILFCDKFKEGGKCKTRDG